MNTFTYSVNLVVEVQAFDQFDAEEMIRDEIGVGNGAAVNVIECEVGDFSVR